MIRLLCLFRAVGIAWGTTGQDVAYRSTPQGESKMAVSDPDGWQPTAAGPGIAFFFWGSLLYGSAQPFYSEAGDLARREMVAAGGEYRVKSKHNTTKGVALIDCQAAFGWIHAHAGEQGFDPAKLSAGGLCAMSILNQSAKPASMVRFNPGGLAQAEPLARIPPTILFFGSADQLYLASALAKN